MPVTKTAKRALRSSLRKRVNNLLTLKKVEIYKRKFKKNPDEKTFRNLVSEIDKAKKKGFFHKNKAARMKSRLSRKKQ